MVVPLTPIRFLYRGIDLFGKKVGVVSGAKRFTYAEFGARCERLATALRANGIKPGDRVATGERIGLIKFGSRTDVLLGQEWEIVVSPGQRVSAGSTIIARRRGTAHGTE